MLLSFEISVWDAVPWTAELICLRAETERRRASFAFLFSPLSSSPLSLFLNLCLLFPSSLLQLMPTSDPSRPSSPLPFLIPALMLLVTSPVVAAMRFYWPTLRKWTLRCTGINRLVRDRKMTKVLGVPCNQ